MNAPAAIPSARRHIFIGSTLANVIVHAIQPAPGSHGLHIGMCVTSDHPDRVMSLRIQGGDAELLAVKLTIDQALTVAELLVRHATNAAQAQAEAEQDATASGGAA